jgi:hypothetical protein
MGAFAGWLHHPAHAPTHYKNVRDLDHGGLFNEKIGERQSSLSMVSRPGIASNLKENYLILQFISKTLT